MPSIVQQKHARIILSETGMITQKNGETQTSARA